MKTEPVATKRYVKRQPTIRAVQWKGEVTLEVMSVVGSRPVRVTVALKGLDLGDGSVACEDDWIVASSDGVAVVREAEFRAIYQEVDDAGHAVVTADEYAQASSEFVEQLDALLEAALRLSRVDHPLIFQRRDRLVRTLQRLFESYAYVVANRELARIRGKINKELL